MSRHPHWNGLLVCSNPYETNTWCVSYALGCRLVNSACWCTSKNCMCTVVPEHAGYVSLTSYATAFIYYENCCNCNDQIHHVGLHAMSYIVWDWLTTWDIDDALWSVRLSVWSPMQLRGRKANQAKVNGVKPMLTTYGPSRSDIKVHDVEYKGTGSLVKSSAGPCTCKWPYMFQTKHSLTWHHQRISSSNICNEEPGCRLNPMDTIPTINIWALILRTWFLVQPNCGGLGMRSIHVCKFADVNTKMRALLNAQTERAFSKSIHKTKHVCALCERLCILHTTRDVKCETACSVQWKSTLCRDLWHCVMTNVPNLVMICNICYDIGEQKGHHCRIKTYDVFRESMETRVQISTGCDADACIWHPFVLCTSHSI